MLVKLKTEAKALSFDLEAARNQSRLDPKDSRDDLLAEQEAIIALLTKQKIDLILALKSGEPLDEGKLAELEKDVKPLSSGKKGKGQKQR